MLDLLKFSIAADDRTARAMGAVKSKLGGVKGALASVEDRAKRAGKAMRNIGVGMSAGITAPLTLLSKQSMDLFDIQAKAQSAVEAAIASTGGAAGKSSEELFKMASGLQAISTFGDEDILSNVTAPLLTFTKIQGETFDRAQGSVLDMATLLKMDLRSASVQVGKALNDPIKGVTALGRAGVQFTEDQKKMIKSMVETGDTAGAQALILNELETQFKGQASAAAKVGLGPMKQLSNAIGDVKEQLGEQIIGFLPPLVEKVQKAVDWFAALSPEVKKNIVVFGGMAAAAGPVLAFFGLATMGIAGISSAFGTLTAIMMANPIIAAIAAVAAGAYLIYRNWDGISSWFSEKWAAVKQVTATAWEGIKAFLLDYTPHGLIYKNWDSISSWFDSKWMLVKMGVIAGWESVKALLADYSPTVLIYNIWTGIGDWFRGLAPDLTAAFGDLWEAIKEEVSQWPERMWQAGKDAVAGLLGGMKAETPKAYQAGGALGNSVTRGAKDKLKVKSPSRVFMGIGKDVVAGLSIGIRDGKDSVVKEIAGVTDAMKETAQAGAQIDQQFGSTFSGIIRGATSAKDAIGRLLDSLADKALTSFFTNVSSSMGIGGFFSSLFGFANGAAFSGGSVVPFATGGVVNSPTFFPMTGGKSGVMGEAGPEAIMPLTRVGGKLGVRAVGGGGGAQSVHVTVGLAADATANIMPVIESVTQNGIKQAAPAMIDQSVQATKNDRKTSKMGWT